MGNHYERRIDQTLASACVLPCDRHTKLVIMSDCHRGDGSLADNFAKNQQLSFHALTHYYNQGYTYIELGDGDELWENRHMQDIKQAHSHMFWLLAQFYRAGRYYMLYGNHDIIKQNSQFLRQELTSFIDERTGCSCPLFPDITVHEAMVLHNSEIGGQLLLLHGHQADFFNDRMWRLSRFLVRYVWRPLELIGVTDPTSASKRNPKKEVIERRLQGWAKKRGCPIVAGHTHRPMFPDSGDTPYYNDGSTVHPRCITALEISNNQIILVKWSVKTRTDGVLFVGRDILEGPETWT